MITNKLNQNPSCDNGIVPIQLQGGTCTQYCLRDISGGPYKGCNVGGWISGDSDTTSCTDCSESRFQSLC